MIVDLPNARRLANDIVASIINATPVRVLEAGGGSRTRLDLARLRVESITTIDISVEQLERNDYAHCKIHGDVEQHRYAEEYDLVVIWDVLEHLRHVDLALVNLAAACRMGGLIVIGGPNPRSFKGMVTRMTPHWVHVQFYKRFLGYPGAGEPGRGPFETHFHRLAYPARLHRFLEERGFRCALYATYEGNTSRRMGVTTPLARALLGLATGTINFVTPKRYDARHSDFVAIFQKTPAATPP